MESPLSGSTEQEHSFLFEDQNKSISGSKPIEIFNSLEALDSYLERNPELVEMPEAGIAGYISYEGDCEFGLYEKVGIGNREKGEGGSAKQSQKFNSIIYPDPEKYIEAVKRCQEYIREGDIYQANLAHRFTMRGVGDREWGMGLYQRLRELNPAPYMGYMNFKNYQIISSSPECFLSIKPLFPIPYSLFPEKKQWTIASSPIKGTASLKDLDYLVNSAKERAEHIMIVDLIRNDLSKICHSVEVPEILATHKFKNLYHLVSTVEGKLQKHGLPKFKDIFAATFPGGSITGAPKIRAIQIIKELESAPRGPYTGTMGYFRFKDGGQFNILIRTIVIDQKTGELSFHVGSGITAESDPQRELEETYLKAEKILELFDGN